LSPLGFAACQSKKCTNQATVHQPSNNCIQTYDSHNLLTAMGVVFLTASFLLHEHLCRSVATLHDVYALLWSVQATTIHVVILRCNVVRCRNRINTTCCLIREIASGIVCHLLTNPVWIIRHSTHKFLTIAKYFAIF